MGIVIAILLFGFIVFFHELGHFLLARKHGIRVDEFWIGMGPTLVHKTIGDTDYCLKLLPIGGACMMGEDDAEDFSEGSFNSKSPLQRISVIAAGPVFNFILAFICGFIFICCVGIDKPVISGVTENMPAAQAGLQAEDEIVKINGKNIHLFREISLFNMTHAGEKMEITYEREGERYTVSLTPIYDEASGSYLMGVYSNGYEKGSVGEILQYSFYEIEYWIEMTLDSLQMLFTRKVGMDQLAGPIGVVDAVDQTYQASKSGGAYLVFLNLLRMTILLSANLGVMNLLPIPALDGGRLFFLLIELIRGKRVPPEKEGYVHLVGMMFLLALMVFIVFNDLRRIFM